MEIVMTAIYFTSRVLYLSLLLFINGAVYSQQIVGLDNYYNYELKSGVPYHYTWDDEDNTGFSQLGSIFQERGAELFTVKGPATEESLRGLDIYIIVDPDTIPENPAPDYLESNDIKAIVDWVKEGGVLVLMANDGGQVCEFTHFNQLAMEFDMAFLHGPLNNVKGMKWQMGEEKDLPDHPLFKGLNKIFMKGTANIQVQGGASVVLSDKDGVLIAENNFGKGYVLAIGDPWLYNEYIDHARLPVDYENLRAAHNFCNLLLEKSKQ